jgi:hypothetical protein
VSSWEKVREALREHARETGSTYFVVSLSKEGEAVSAVSMPDAVWRALLDAMIKEIPKHKPVRRS